MDPSYLMSTARQTFSIRQYDRHLYVGDVSFLNVTISEYPLCRLDESSFWNMSASVRISEEKHRKEGKIKKNSPA